MAAGARSHPRDHPYQRRATILINAESGLQSSAGWLDIDGRAQQRRWQCAPEASRRAETALHGV